MNFRDPNTMMALSLMVFMFGIIFGFVAFPKMLRSIIKSQANLVPGSPIRAVYEKPPFYLNFLIYVFNVTNKEEVISGKKPKLQEIGPYFFEEWKEKFDAVDDDEEDTVTFHYKNTYIFRPDLSGNLTGDETIVIPHLMIAGLFLATNYDKQPLLGAIEGAVNNLFHNPTDVFYTGRAMDLFFDGVSIDCSNRDHTFTAAACMQLEEQDAIQKFDDDHLKFSMFGGSNGTDLGELTASRGKKKHQDLGRLLKVNGEPEADTWDEDECNEFKGTDTTIIPPLMHPGEVIWGYDQAICRSMGTTYANVQTKQNGIPVYVYELDIGNEINARHCFCRDEDTCPAHGSFDLFRCMGLPIYGTQPHFYKAEQLLDGIASGLNPKKEDHALFVNLEILTGAPISVAKRMQFNLDMKPIPQIEIMKTMPEIYFPVFWIEESVELGSEITDQLKYMYWAIYVVIVLKWTMVGLGAFGILGSGARIVISGDS